MLTRNRPGGYLHVRTEPTLEAARELEAEGYTLVRRAFTGEDLDTLRQEAENVFEKLLPDNRGSNKKYEIADHFRYEMFNRSVATQEVIARREILDVIEPLLGEDCHVIANTCWRNPPGGAGHGGGSWHIDAGPHVPLTEDQIWPDEIPHPTFAVGVHLFLQDCGLDSGPTGVIPGSHKSGLPPPTDRLQDVSLTWNNKGVRPLEACAGDLAFFVSDIWHRRLPPTDSDKGRFFLQIHYGRRDIAQRIKPTSIVNHVEPEAAARLQSERERNLVGLHRMGFYDG